MQLPDSAHTTRPWRIHQLTRDFRVEDVWQLPWTGDAGEFRGFVDLIATMRPARISSLPARALIAVRRRIGEVLGWDRPGRGTGARVRTLRDRLPADLRDWPGPDVAGLPFSSLYLTEDEWAAEGANQTVHAVVHIGRIPDEHGGFRAQMAILVKPNGPLGIAYMAAIRPFRHLIVYPALLREIDQLARHEPAPIGDRPV